jgi:SAM-dependent methyltransferase
MSRPPESRPIRTFADFREAIFAYRLPRVLIAAIELDLFTTLGAKPWRLSALARTLKVSERGLDILCRNLASVGLIKKAGDVYRNGPLAGTMLNANHPAYRHGYLNLIRDQWNDWARLPEVVRRGRPVEHEDPDDPEYRRSFTWAMHHRSLEIAPKVAAQVDLRGVGTLLDLGGGPGTYALAFLAHNPHLRAVLCDRAPALEVAREIAAPLRHGRRLSYLPLDFMEKPIPGRYDVIWFSNVLHIYSPKDNQALFGRIRKTLNHRGRLIIQDAFLHDRHATVPLEANLFAVTMLLFTEAGNTYRLSETRDWLRQAGFDRVVSLPLKQGTGDWDDGLLEARFTGRASRRAQGHR